MQTDTRFRANGIKRGRASHVESSLQGGGGGGGGKREGERAEEANCKSFNYSIEKMACREIVRGYSRLWNFGRIFGSTFAGSHDKDP